MTIPQILDRFKRILCFLIIFSCLFEEIKSQNEAQFIAYNTLVGAVTGGVGAIINKKKDQKWHQAFIKGFVIGSGGGALAYTGKKINSLVAQKHELGYCWISRALYSAGNSIVENAAANRDFWSQWHYDIGFIRCELQIDQDVSFRPKLMPSTFGGIVFLAANGILDKNSSLKSGTLTFRAEQVNYATYLSASTASNGFLFVNSLNQGDAFYNTYAHEMVHAFQFQEFSGFNYFFNPLTDKWKAKSPAFKNLSKWVYGDLNFELMLINYFLIQKAYKDDVDTYCENFLEREAEYLSVHDSPCGD